MKNQTVILEEKDETMNHSEAQERIREFLKDRPALNINILEKEAGLSPTTLAHFIAGKRNVPKKRIADLIKVLAKYGFTL
jgi:hypothetical protein